METADGHMSRYIHGHTELWLRVWRESIDVFLQHTSDSSTWIIALCHLLKLAHHSYSPGLLQKLELRQAFRLQKQKRRSSGCRHTRTHARARARTHTHARTHTTFLSFRFLWPCIVRKVWREREKTNKMQQLDVYYQLLSQYVSGIIMPIFRITKTVLLQTVYCAGSAGCGW
jgi:hypothetical protein